MSRHCQRGLPFTRLAGIAALACTAAILSLPVAAQDTDAGQATNNPATGAPSDNGTQDTGAGASSPQPGVANGEQASQASQEDQKPPSETLPEPKSSDYGASSFNAPSDAELDNFDATHQPSAEDGQNAREPMGNQTRRENQDRGGSYGGSSITAPTPPNPIVNQSPTTPQHSH